MKMKLALLLSMLTAGVWAGNLIQNADFKADLNGFRLSTPDEIFLLVQDGDRKVLKVTGSEELDDEELKYQKMQQNFRKFTADELKGCKVKFTFDAKVEKISGKITVAVREADATGKTIVYQSFLFNSESKANGWEKFSKEFEISPGCTDLGIYIMVVYPAVGDAFYLANPDVSLVAPEKTKDGEK